VLDPAFVEAEAQSAAIMNWVQKVKKTQTNEYTLSAWVLWYLKDRAANSPQHPQVAKLVPLGPPSPVMALDGALPTSMLRTMQKGFGTGAPFWPEHRYACLGGKSRTPDFFSYFHRLEDKPRSRLDQIIHHIKDLVAQNFPAVKHARHAEWWAHCRGHGFGHQLHYDSEDEGRGRVRHPLISTVLYLSESDTGGPTIVTTQTIGGQMAQKGWVMSPRTNRLVMFQGNMLHGVIPGHGCPGRRCGFDGDKRRITFMCAFWDKLTEHRFNRSGASSSQPYPYPGAVLYGQGEKVYNWPFAFADESCNANTTCQGSSEKSVTNPVSAWQIPQVWEHLLPEL